jgi:hypothetical protein
MPPRSFSRWTGLALGSGGALTVLLNVSLSPFLGHGVPFVVAATTSVFLWRQSLSALAVALLLLGSVGLYLRQAERAGRFGAVAFAMAFLGSALVLAWEWIDIFILRDLARRAPRTLQMLEEAKGLNLYDLGALIPIGLFTLGWIALAASTIRVWRDLRLAAVLVIVGLFAIPLLGAALGAIWGGIFGNVILGSGWFLLGLGVWREAAAGVGSTAAPPGV